MVEWGQAPLLLIGNPPTHPDFLPGRVSTEEDVTVQSTAGEVDADRELCLFVCVCV